MFVIAASQVVESMVVSQAPTHAAVAGVEGALFDRADAVALSRESANGKYPVEAVMAQASAAREAESVKHRLRRACPLVESSCREPARLHVSMCSNPQEKDDGLRKSRWCPASGLPPGAWT